MPKEINSPEEIQPGDIYEDSAYHPCLCIGINGYEIWGVSLIDGSHPRCEDIGFSGIRKLTPEEAWIWRTQGPRTLIRNSKNGGGITESDRNFWRKGSEPQIYADYTDCTDDIPLHELVIRKDFFVP
jgi:hypothetical protein